MDKILRALLAKKQQALQAATALNELAAGENRELSADEQAKFDALTAEIEGLNGKIAAQQRLIEAARTAPGVTLPAGNITVTENAERDPQRGFAHLGQFARAVMGATLQPHAADDRLLTLNAAAASTYGNEAVGADGGFLVPPAYATEILSVIESPEALMPRTRRIQTGGNQVVFPANETTAHGTTGVQAYWDSEASTITQTKPAFGTRTLRLGRLTALVPVTEELLEDSPAMGTWVQMEAGEKLAFKVTDAILRGTGAGMPLGILAAPCLVTVTKETSQAAATILGANVLKMWSRMPVANRSRAVWLVHSDLEAQLPTLNIPVKNVAGTENVAGTPVFVPPGGLSGAQYGQLFGRPIIPIESCSALGTVGDIVLADLSQYITLEKAGGVKADQSIHLWFDQNLRAFRFVLRVGGMPWLSSAIARKNGSSTLSHFVTLETRS